jgi:hypothetical protein
MAMVSPAVKIETTATQVAESMLSLLFSGGGRAVGRSARRRVRLADPM